MPIFGDRCRGVCPTTSSPAQRTMDPHWKDGPKMLAIELQRRLRALLAERRVAEDHGLADDGAYMADLLEEISQVRAAYTEATVVEIASLRGASFGRQVG